MAFDAALTAWTTFSLALLAVVTAIFAGLAWNAQARQLKALKQLNEKQIPVLEGQQAELQASRTLREREERDRRERFVSLVFCWQEIAPDRQVMPPQETAGRRPGMVSSTYVRNTGPAPVYDVGFSFWIGDTLEAFSTRPAPLMPPGGERAEDSETHWHQPIPHGIDAGTINVAVFMRDAVGNLWRLRPGGHYDAYREDMLPTGTWRVAG
jgi:hypothetical protein